MTSCNIQFTISKHDITCKIMKSVNRVSEYKHRAREYICLFFDKHVLYTKHPKIHLTIY